MILLIRNAEQIVEFISDKIIQKDYPWNMKLFQIESRDLLSRRMSPTYFSISLPVNENFNMNSRMTQMKVFSSFRNLM